MFNVGGGELLVIALIALIVLGPQRLPGAARQVGKTMGDLRRMSSGFQNELRTAFDDAERSPAPVAPVAITPEPVGSASVVAAIDAVSSQAAPAAAARKQPAKKAPATKNAPAKKAPAKKKAAPKKAPAKKKAAPKKAPAKKKAAVPTGARRRSPR
jgi:Tat protein translocase TatB subunit